MADKPKMPPGSITEEADKMHDERMNTISNVSKTVNAMRKRAQTEMQDLERDIKQNKDVQAVETSMNRVLKKLGDTIGSLNKGMQQITVGTAKATKDAIAQYGKALNEDIGFQKKNFVAMTLARTTPLFGYFAAKFMETDVFRNATARMRENIGNALSGVWGGVKRASRKLTGRGEPDQIPLGKTAAKEIPKMQRGGYVEKGGMVRVHAGEVVAPIEKVLARVDESISTAKDLASIAKKTQLSMLADMHTFVKGETKKVPAGIVRGFINAYAKVQQRYQEPTDKRMLRALLAIQEAIGAQPNTMSQVWAEFISEHPWFRNMLFMGRIMGKAFGTAFFKPIRFFFKTRGGYEADLSDDENPLRAMSHNIGALYAGTMWRLDNIARFTRRTAETTTDLSSFFTGRRYPRVEGVEEPGWTIMGLITKGISKIFSKVIFRPIEGILAGTLMMAAASEGKEAQGRMILRRYSNIKGRIGAFFTRRKEKRALHGGFLTHGFRGGMYEDVYGRGAAPLGRGGGAGRAIRLMPKLIKDQADYYKPGKKVMEMLESRIPKEMKQSRKMITMTAGVQKELQIHNKREKRRTLMKWLGMGLQPIWAALKEVGSVVLESVKGFLGNKVVWAALGAGLVGAGIGTAINKFAIQPLVDYAHAKFFGGEEKLKSEKGVQEGRSKFGIIKAKMEAGTATAEDIAWFRGYGKTVETGGVGAAKVESKLVKQWGHDREAVENYMQVARQKNAPLYSLYSQDEISRVREQWIKRGFSVSKYWKVKDPEMYAMRVEQDFADYLKAEGTPKQYERPAMTEGSAASRAQRKVVGEVRAKIRTAGGAVIAAKGQVDAEIMQAIAFWDQYTQGGILRAIQAGETTWKEVYNKNKQYIDPYIPIAKSYMKKGKAMSKEIRNAIDQGVMIMGPMAAQAIAEGKLKWQEIQALHKQGQLYEETKKQVGNVSTNVSNAVQTQISNMTSAGKEVGGKWLSTAAEYWDGFILSGAVR